MKRARETRTIDAIAQAQADMGEEGEGRARMGAFCGARLFRLLFATVQSPIVSAPSSARTRVFVKRAG